MSMKCYKALSWNRENMFAAAKKSKVPNFVVFQVLEVGYGMPIVGLSKGLELLMWYYPTPANIYYGTFCMILLTISPFGGFISNGAHINIYPYVPFFGWILEKAYKNIIKKEMKQAVQKQVAAMEGPPEGGLTSSKNCVDGSTIRI
ncbi:hypothetical protein HDV01_001887 [Terramyces sp. JEL0728]|nr:hypothetical protein HDV01_001887 [Terramyces sp. JEL0728]